MGRRTPAPSEPRAGLPSRVQATVHVARPHAVAHLLAGLTPGPGWACREAARTRPGHRGP
eukprot:8618305-Alexandrium_andersonii.AAC.1